jgi:hypothetical protein
MYRALQSSLDEQCGEAETLEFNKKIEKFQVLQ